MKMEVSKLTGAALDWAVATCEQMAWQHYDELIDLDLCRQMPPRPSEYIRDYHFHKDEFKPSSDWAVGGPIIERLRITIDRPLFGSQWIADIRYMEHDGICRMYATSPLEAAMRCYVKSILYEAIDVPDEYCS